MTIEQTTEAGDERARVGRAMLRAYAVRPDSLVRQTGGTIPSLLTPNGRLLAAEQLLHDLLAALADDGVNVPVFLADTLAEAWGEDEAETTPFIRYRPPSWVDALGRAAVELYGAYGDRHMVIPEYDTYVVNDAAQLVANLDEYGTPDAAEEIEPGHVALTVSFDFEETRVYDVTTRIIVPRGDRRPSRGTPVPARQHGLVRRAGHRRLLGPRRRPRGRDQQRPDREEGDRSVSKGKQALIVQNPSTGEYEVYGHVYTDKGLKELEAEAAKRGLTVIASGRLTSKAELAERPY
ncbi:hypothetical protein [Nonomuraea sp. JJY05]|uniref:hypothetical protein n=1 Tax=Nonomuraea sp. JJY05 TaxID=3350255 RepID=UPI00373FBC57